MKKIFIMAIMIASTLLTGCDLEDILVSALPVNVSLKNTTARFEIWYRYEKKDNGRNEWRTIKEGSLLPNSTDYLESPGGNFNGTVRIVLIQAYTPGNPAFPIQGWATVPCSEINKVEFVISGTGTSFSVQGYGTKQ